MKKDSDDKNAIKEKDERKKDRNNTNTVFDLFIHSFYIAFLYYIVIDVCYIYISMLDNNIYLNLLFFSRW
jgi:hypothetical protein